MKKLLFLLILAPNLLFAQKWVDTTFQITIEKDSMYGSAIDFAGNVENLTLDIAYPSNDTAPSCGRPLILVLYGGAWMGGNKDIAEVQRLMKEFAQRGYVAVAPNYRLGMFQTNQDKNCNISTFFDVEWNCLNAQDSSEWYRAYYRSIQDIKGALRYMVNKQDQYNINPNNIFTTGFSAGGFTALGTAFLDHPSELSGLTASFPDAKAPHSRYDAGCVKKYGWDTSISSMNLARPDLGSIDGDINFPAYSSYKIKAVGNLFGGMFFNLLDSGSKDIGIYGFHQPNDLIVPYKKNRKVFHGLNDCAYGFCNQSIIHRPFVYSSPTIRDWAISASIDFFFDSTKNNTDCAGQISEPSKGGHQLDNWNRTWNMANYFASKIDTTDCKTTLSLVKPMKNFLFTLYPNPAKKYINISSSSPIYKYQISDLHGRVIMSNEIAPIDFMQINIQEIPSGLYIIKVFTKLETFSKKIKIQ